MVKPAGERESAAGGVAALFDRLADTYEQVAVPWFAPIAEGLVRALDPRPGERVLDVGCGTGAALLPLAHAVGVTGRVHGVDLAPRMVERARAASRDLPWVTVEVADAAALPPCDPPYDLLTSSLVLFFLPDPVGALRGWRDQLRSGGRLGVATFGQVDPVWEHLDGVFTPYLPPALADARTTGKQGPFASDEGMTELLHSAGLREVLTERTTVVARFRDPEHWEQFSRSHGQRVMWEHVPDQLQHDVRERAFATLGTVQDPVDGSIALSQQVRYTIGRRP